MVQYSEGDLSMCVSRISCESTVMYREFFVLLLLVSVGGGLHSLDAF